MRGTIYLPFFFFLSARLRINALRPACTRVQHSCGHAGWFHTWNADKSDRSPSAFAHVQMMGGAVGLCASLEGSINLRLSCHRKKTTT